MNKNRTTVEVARLCSGVFRAVLSLFLFSSCSTERVHQSRLPPPVALDSRAGFPGPLCVMVGLRSGEKLPFLLDTGAPVTCLDKSLEQRLGKRLGIITASNFGVAHEAAVYEAPQLYLGDVPLKMIGTNVITWDFKRGPPKGSPPYVGILGMHVLLNYCIQLDFADRRMRFLAPSPANTSAWGTPLALIGVGDGCVAIQENLSGIKGPPSLIDTGYRGDGFLTPEIFQRWTNHAMPALSGETRAPNGLLGGKTYSNVIQLSAESLSLGDPPRPFNGIGLHFLARHLVTFDFPNNTMYLQRNTAHPLVEATLKKASDEAGQVLDRLKRKGQLPGWSRQDAFANKTETIQLRYPVSATFAGVRKKGDPSLYHYELAREGPDQPWRLQKAWRTDQDGHLLEEYAVP